MKLRLRGTRHAPGLALVAAVIVAGSLAATPSSHAAAPALGHISVHPEFSAPQTPTPGDSADTFDCQSLPIDGSQGSRCYSPQQLQQAYGLSGLLSSGVTGKGKTIVIVDAFSNPYIKTDLQLEDQRFGLPDPKFSIVGKPPAFDFTSDEQLSWAGEISLDVLSAHAMAPGAKIVLVEADGSSDADLFAADKYAVDHHLGDVLSQSFNEAETCVDPKYFKRWQDLYRRASDRGWTIFAATGDSGAAQFSCDGNGAVFAPAWPAVDPYVTAVGGTTLDASDPAGNYIGETAWTEPTGCNPPASDPLDVNCSGGGFSALFPRPAWQKPLPKPAPPGHPPAPAPGRGVPDVAWDAGIDGGLLIHCGVFLQVFFGVDPTTPAFFIFGGTSAGPPQWSGLAADADQMAHGDLGNIDDNLYRLAQGPPPPHGAVYLHDITTGNNDVVEIGGQGYDAGPGWDPVTGLGTPNAAQLLPALAKPGPPRPPGRTR